MAPDALLMLARQLRRDPNPDAIEDAAAALEALAIGGERMPIVTLKERQARALARRRAAQERVEAMLAAAAAQHGGRYRLYGSAARGELRADSDIDLLADFPAHNVSAAIGAAEDACADLGLSCDIIDQTWCTEEFLRRVLPGSKVLA